MNADNLNLAGEALKSLGEETVILGCYAPCSWRDAYTFSIRLELEGTSGVHGSGATVEEALNNALRQREQDATRMERDERIRALGEAALVGEPHREAA